MNPAHDNLKKTVLQISQKEQLYQLLDQFKVFVVRTQLLELNLPDFTDQQNKHYQEQLNQYYKACGCSEGALGGTIATFLATIVFFADVYWLHYFPLTRLLIGLFIVVFAGMTIGKMTGLVRAKKKMAQCIVEMTTSPKQIQTH